MYDSSRARAAVQRALSSPSFRVYTNDDVTGVELCGALKNVMAVATGIAEGLDLGLNSRAALITRGLAEMTRLGKPNRMKIYPPFGKTTEDGHSFGYLGSHLWGPDVIAFLRETMGR